MGSWGAEAEAAGSALDALLDRYTLELRPRYCLKLRKRLGTLDASVDYLFGEPKGGGLSLTLKSFGPWKRERWWDKVYVNPANTDLRLYTRKIQIGVLKLQAVLGYDWHRNRGGVSWRLSTAWTRSVQSLERKESIQVSDHVEIKPHWSLDYSMPAMEGEMGTGQEAVDVDYGFCHFSIPQVDAIVRLDDALEETLLGGGRSGGVGSSSTSGGRIRGEPPSRAGGSEGGWFAPASFSGGEGEGDPYSSSGEEVDVAASSSQGGRSRYL